MHSSEGTVSVLLQMARCFDGRPSTNCLIATSRQLAFTRKVLQLRSWGLILAIKISSEVVVMYTMNVHLDKQALNYQKIKVVKAQKEEKISRTRTWHF